jgi:5'-3' exonuclease
MYDVLRKYSAEHPYDAATKSRWEASLREAIAAYMGELVALAAPTRGVYVSCDGVVCAAKRKQQRLRRFKGPWIRDMEAQISGTVATADTWDQNALTPGSAFMADLDRTLAEAGARLQARNGLQVHVSTTSDPGEGEHKILRYMRDVRPASCTIYGLDADLILLSMLLWADTGASVRLLREAQEFETRRPKTTSHEDDNEWRTLDIVGLKDAMGFAGRRERVRDFVATMTLLGNDFLPRPLTKTVREDGIPTLLHTLETAVWSRGTHIVTADGALSRAGLLALVSAWATTEESDMMAAATNARRAMYRSGGGDPLQTWNGLPATWGSLTQLLRPDGTALIPAWRDHYTRTWMAGEAADYCAGVGWTWDYYSGRSVEQGWHFGAHLPPLWSAVVAHLRATAGEHVPAPTVVHATPLPAWVHLLSVLPAASVHRLLAADAAAYMETAPQFWPTSWSLFDVGRTQMWECEPVIPVVPESVLRSWTTCP